MGLLYKRRKNWHTDIRFKGRRIRQKVGPSKKLVELALKDAEVKIARDEYGFTKNDVTIDKFFSRFVEYSKASHQPPTSNDRHCLKKFKQLLT